MKKTALQRINVLIHMAETLENYFLAKELKEIKKELTNKNK